MATITARTRRITYTIRNMRPVSEGHRAYWAGRADNVPSLKLVLFALNDTLDCLDAYRNLRDESEPAVSAASAASRREEEASSNSRISKEDVQQMSDRTQLLELFERLLAQYHTCLTLVEEDY